MEQISVIAAVVGLGAALAFLQARRAGSDGDGVAAFGQFLVLPSLGYDLWRVAAVIGWWTLAVFILVGALVGALNGLYLNFARGRAAGVHPWIALQPVQAGIFLTATGASLFTWLSR